MLFIKVYQNGSKKTGQELQASYGRNPCLHPPASRNLTP